MTARKSPAARKTSRSTRTKAELEEEVEELKSRLDGEPELSPQAHTLAKEHVKEVREAVKGVSVDAIVQQGAKFGLEAQRTVTGLTEQIAAKATELKTIQDAIIIEEMELARLYDLDVAAASVKALIEDHETNKARLEKEQETAQAIWQEEVNAHTKAVAQRNQELQQNRQREQNEYDYKVRLERQKANDEFAQQMLLQNREQANRVDAVNKDISVRLEALQAQEQELAVFKERVANIDVEISAKVKQAEAITRNVVTKDLTNDFLMQKKDLEIQLRVLEEKKTSVDQANEKLANQVVQLQAQLDAAREQVVKISERALESASGQVALTAVRETVKEGSNNGGSSRKGS